MKFRKKRQLTWIVTSEKSYNFTSFHKFMSLSKSVTLRASPPFARLKKVDVRYFTRKSRVCSFEMHHSTWHLGNSQPANFHPSGKRKRPRRRKRSRSVRADDARLQHNAVSVRARRYEIMRGHEGPRNPGRGTRAMAHSDLRRKANSRGSNQPDYPGYVAPIQPPHAPPFPSRPSLSATPTGLLSAL